MIYWYMSLISTSGIYMSPLDMYCISREINKTPMILTLNGLYFYSNGIKFVYKKKIQTKLTLLQDWYIIIIQYLHLAPSHRALPDETESPCSREGSHSVTILALLCTDPQSSLMSLDKYLWTAEQEGRQGVLKNLSHIQPWNLVWEVTGGDTIWW